MMQAIIERCCGLDVHQETVVACLLIGAPGVRPTKEVRTFRTVTRDLEALRDWLKAAGVTHVGMESTGVYWRPVYAVLEEHFELIVGNARHIRNVPGRKTDVKDSEWIADLVRHGLIARRFYAGGRRSKVSKLRLPSTSVYGDTRCNTQITPATCGPPPALMIDRYSWRWN
jgi:transposase